MSFFYGVDFLPGDLLFSEDFLDFVSLAGCAELVFWNDGLLFFYGSENLLEDEGSEISFSTKTLALGLGFFFFVIFFVFSGSEELLFFSSAYFFSLLFLSELDGSSKKSFPLL